MECKLKGQNVWTSLGIGVSLVNYLEPAQWIELQLLNQFTYLHAIGRA